MGNGSSNNGARSFLPGVPSPPGSRMGSKNVVYSKFDIDDVRDVVATPNSPSWVPPALQPYCNKGDLSNVTTFLIMLVGLYIEVYVLTTDEERKGNFVLAFGLFGFAGGFTWGSARFSRLCRQQPYRYLKHGHFITIGTKFHT